MAFYYGYWDAYYGYGFDYAFEFDSSYCCGYAEGMIDFEDDNYYR